jgi:hypothetical protein
VRCIVGPIIAKVRPTWPASAVKAAACNLYIARRDEVVSCCGAGGEGGKEHVNTRHGERVSEAGARVQQV